MEDDFKEKINHFINISKNTNDNSVIKIEYLKLVKTYHPDTNKDIDAGAANEYMIIINYVYEQLIHNKGNFRLVQKEEYDKNKINGKYIFVNEFGVKEFISDKVLFIYKLGKLEYNKAMSIMLDNPSYSGNKEKTGYEIIGHLYKAYKYYKDVIKMDKSGNWKKVAIINLYYAYKMNEHITRGLKISDEKGMVKV
jgi:curved DNA-binding protein CbpA